MPYKPYLTIEEYKGTIPKNLLEKQLLQASRHIDSLTFNRIVGKFDRLTEFQQEIIKEVCASLAEFEYENSEMLNSVLKSYSINGVTAEFGGKNIQRTNGVVIPCELYRLLSQTGLCCLRFGRYVQ